MIPVEDLIVSIFALLLEQTIGNLKLRRITIGGFRLSQVQRGQWPSSGNVAKQGVPIVGGHNAT